MSSQQPKGRLISHFENREPTDHGRAWSDLWESGDSDLWDRGEPSPALIDLVEKYHDTLFCPFRGDAPEDETGTERKRKRVLVPGCGRGYDVIALSLHGFDAYGLEISSTAVSEAESFSLRETVNPSPNNFGVLGDTTSKYTPGTARFLQGDFFDSAWSDALGFKFDVIYDYTFLCALHPSLRGAWAERMAGLLGPGALLVCLEFPMYKDPALPGPPWGVKGVHWQILAGGDRGGGRFTRRVYLQPERTYRVGKGTDMISVYERN